MREALQLVAERLELAVAAGVLERAGQQPVGQRRVARQQRAVEVGADRRRHAAALEARRAVVPVPGEHASERRRAGIEQRPAGVVLEPRHRRRDAVAEVDLEQHVADQPPLAGDGLEREEPGARHPGAVAAAVAAPEQLVAAAHGEQRRSRLDGPPQVVAPPREVGRDERLLAILAAADVDEVERRRLERIARLDGRHLERMPAEGRPAGEDGDVAAVGVDVEVVRVEVRDADPHGASSQNGRTRPRLTAIARSSSIAV